MDNLGFFAQLGRCRSLVAPYGILLIIGDEHESYRV